MAQVLKGQELLTAKEGLARALKKSYDSGQRTWSYNAQQAIKKKTGQDVQLPRLSAQDNAANQYRYWDKAPVITGDTPNWVERVYRSSRDLAGDAARTVGGAIVTTVQDVGKVVGEAALAVPNLFTNVRANERRRDLDIRGEEVLKRYQEGKLSKQQYLDEMNDIAAGYKQIYDDTSAYTEKTRWAYKLDENGDVDTVESLITIASGAFTLATLGAGASVGAGVRAAWSVAPKTLATKVVENQARTIATQAAKEKAVIATIEKGAEQLLAQRVYQRMATTALAKVGTSRGLQNEVKNVIVEAAIRAPLRRENIRFTLDVIDSYEKQEYFHSSDGLAAVPSTVLVAGMLTMGGPLKFLGSKLKRLGGSVRASMYGEPTFYDALNTSLNNRGVQGTVTAAIREIRETGTEDMVQSLEKYLKQAQEYNLQGRGLHAAGEAAAESIVDALAGSFRNPATITMKEAMENLLNWAEAQDALTSLNKRLGDKGYAAVVKYDKNVAASLSGSISKALNAQSKQIKNLATHEERMAARQAIAKDIIEREASKGAYWANNEKVVNQILQYIKDTNSAKALVNAPRKINAATLAKFSAKELPAEVRNKLAAKGYAAAVIKHPVRVFKAGEEVGDQTLASKFVPVNDDLFKAAATAKPFFRQIGETMTKFGIGVDETSQAAYAMTRNNATAYINQGLKNEAGAPIINALQQYVESGTYGNLVRGKVRQTMARTATDLRMLTINEIQTVLQASGILGKIKITPDIAKVIRNAITQAHLDVPIHIQGLANKMISGAYRATPFRYYLRAQGAGRYTLNPFFRTQEIVETELLGQALVGGKKPWVLGFGKLAGKTKQELDDIVTLMEKKGFYHDGMMATRYGEAATDVFIGKMGVNIIHTQKRSLAAVVERMAQKYRMPVSDLLEQYPQDVIDMVRPIIQYPSKGILNSNLAKAVNIAVFPARYNVKVTQLAVKALSEAPPAMQVAVINKLWDFETWLRGDEGLAWQREHADLLGAINWLTPIGSVQWVFDTLATPFGGGNESVGDFGIIGGLPFGLFTQLLDSQGIIKLNTPYIKPETAEIYAKYTPESVKARAASAFTDLLGSTFTYPGRVIGLPGKGQFLRDLAQIPFPNESEEWTKTIYNESDLPEFSKRKQAVWRQKYLQELGYNVDDVPAQEQYDRIVTPEAFIGELKSPDLPTLNKTELLKLKREKEEAKKSARAKDSNGTLTPRTGAKKATFPSNLPQ